MADSNQLAALRENQHPPFARGNLAAEKHGAKSAPWRLAARTQEIADELRPLIMNYRPSDELQLALLAETLTRIEKASRWIEQQASIISTRGRPLPILADVARWESAASKYAASLGLSSPNRSEKTAPADVLADYLSTRQEPS